LGLGRQLRGRELTGLAMEPRDVDTLALAVGEARKRCRVRAPVDEVLFTGGADAPGQNRRRSGGAEKSAASHRGLPFIAAGFDQTAIYQSGFAKSIPACRAAVAGIERETGGLAAIVYAFRTVLHEFASSP